ncbi:MAG: ion transporter [Acidobacteriota bacterium]
MKIKKRIFEILEIATSGDKVSKLFDIFIVSLISLNIIAVILETVHSLGIKHQAAFKTIEIISVVVFTVEYLFRVWSCTQNSKYEKQFSGRLKFIFSPMLVIDLFAILPFYLPLIFPFDLRFIRVLRLFRLFRLFKLGRYSDAIKMIGLVIKNKKEELLITLFIVFLLLIVSASVLYYCEHEIQPEVFSSIPAAMWWGIATLTTVGYGDVYPVTTIGKIFGAVICLVGIGLFALPTGILGAGFIEVIKDKRQKRTCPNCGSLIE